MGKHLSILAPIFILLVIGLWDVDEGQASPIKKHGKHISSAHISKKKTATAHVGKHKRHTHTAQKAKSGKHRIAKHKNKSTRVAKHASERSKRLKVARLMRHHAGYTPAAAIERDAPAFAGEDRSMYAPMDSWLAQHFHALDMERLSEEDAEFDLLPPSEEDSEPVMVAASYHYWGLALSALEPHPETQSDSERSWLAFAGDAADETARYSLRLDTEQGILVAQGAEQVITPGVAIDTLAQDLDGYAADAWLIKDRQARRTYKAGAEPDEAITFKILESAHNYLGTPYRYGGTTPAGFDCSGFVRYVFNENGIKLGRSSRDQAQDGIHVPLSALKPGDLIFFSMHRRKHHQRIDHVGVYIGDGQFIHAASSRSRQISIGDLKSVTYHNRVVTARRVTASTN